jgi:hypothetical protein
MNVQFRSHFGVLIKQIVKKYKEFCHKMTTFARLHLKNQKKPIKTQKHLLNQTCNEGVLSLKLDCFTIKIS